MRKGGGDRIVREFGMDMYILLYFKWITSKVLRAQGTLLCYAGAWMGGD